MTGCNFVHDHGWQMTGNRGSTDLDSPTRRGRCLQYNTVDTNTITMEVA